MINTGNTNEGQNSPLRAKMSWKRPWLRLSRKSGAMKNHICRSRYLEKAEAMSQQTAGL